MKMPLRRCVRTNLHEVAIVDLRLRKCAQIVCTQFVWKFRRQIRSKEAHRTAFGCDARDPIKSERILFVAQIEQTKANSRADTMKVMKIDQVDNGIRTVRGNDKRQIGEDKEQVKSQSETPGSMRIETG